MKRLILLLLAMLMSFTCAYAQENNVFEMAGQVHGDLPVFNIRISDSGQYQENALRERVLQVSVQAQDGSFSQELTYQASETPGQESTAAFARLDDLNFDGYEDLLLLTAQGARNVFYAVSLWDADAGRFREVEQTMAWDEERRQLSATEVVQLELCEPELFPESKQILSTVADGYLYRLYTLYDWESRYGQVVRAVANVYDAGDHQVGETLVYYATRLTRCWDEQYPESWYCEQQGVYEERNQAIREMLLGRATWDATLLQVANVDWVHLRKQDSKASESLAKLNAGTQVVQLVEGVGEDDGWVRVWYQADASDEDETGLTGYIWHSFLQPVN